MVTVRMGGTYVTRDGQRVVISAHSCDGAGFCSAPDWYASWEADGRCRQNLLWDLVEEVRDAPPAPASCLVPVMEQLMALDDKES